MNYYCAHCGVEVYDEGAGIQAGCSARYWEWGSAVMWADDDGNVNFDYLECQDSEFTEYCGDTEFSCRECGEESYDLSTLVTTDYASVRQIRIENGWDDPDYIDEDDELEESLWEKVALTDLRVGEICSFSTTEVGRNKGENRFEVLEAGSRPRMVQIDKDAMRVGRETNATNTEVWRMKASRQLVAANAALIEFTEV